MSKRPKPLKNSSEGEPIIHWFPTYRRLLPSLADIEFLDLTSVEKKSVRNYVCGRIRRIMKAEKEGKKIVKNFDTMYGDFMFGRKAEAEQILAMIDKLKPISKKKK